MGLISKLDKGLKYLNEPALFRIKKLGFNIETYSEFKKPFYQAFNFQVILDIGANIGQTAITLNKAFPNAEIFSFEPIPNCFEILNNVTKNNSKIHTFNYALGDTVGFIDFNKNDFTASSSLLNVGENHIKNFPKTAVIEKIQVPIKKLDDVVDLENIKGNILAKIDVQGFEDKVIAGGKKVLSNTKLVIVETSMEELYDNQPLFDDIYNTLKNLGYKYIGAFEQLFSPIDGRILQQDAVFVKE